MKDFNLTKYRNMAIALPLAPKSLIIRLIKEPEKTGYYDFAYNQGVGIAII